MQPDFEKYPDGLMPAIVQDADTQVVLMLGFMNAEALETTRNLGKVTFFSRSKNRLWTKGEESGNFLLLDRILLDCDADTLLVKARPMGNVCHTGNFTCFDEHPKDISFLTTLEAMIDERTRYQPERSYVARLVQKGINKIAQKVGEEAVELVIEAKDNNDDLFKNEAADLLFHYLILLNAKGFRLNDVVEVLRQRNKPTN